MSYADVEIFIRERQANGYPVEITVNSEIGQQEYSGGVLDPNGGPGMALASYADKQHGLDLFNWLFADVRMRIQWAKIAGEHPQRRVRLRIAKEAAELHPYPWEALYEPAADNGGLRLAAADATPFSRYLAGQWQPGKPIIARPVRILVAIANPSNLATQNPPLDVIVVKDEWAALQQAVQKIKGTEVTLKLLDEPCTLQRLTDELRQGYHILHLICHGAASDQASVLYLADDNNLVKRIKDTELAEQLALQLTNTQVDVEKKLRLVVFASCQTATRSAYNAFRGVAPQVVAAGVPAVLAMQDNVGIDAAREFAAAFYSRLLEHGQVDLAVNQARQALLASVAKSNQQQIAIPALFLRLKNGQVLGQRGATTGQQPDKFWPFLLRNIESNRCTVFLGPRIHGGVLPSQAEIASKLAETYDYPLRDTTNLAHVAQYMAIQDEEQLRDFYLQLMVTGIPRRLNLGENDYQKAGLEKKRIIGQVVDELHWIDHIHKVQEEEPHLLLADLPIGLYLTSNVDGLMQAALTHKIQQAIKAEPDPDKRNALLTRLPRRLQPRWEKVEAGPDHLPLEPLPTPEQPVIVHVNGYDEDPEHMVLSEDDYLHHLVRLMRDQEALLPSPLLGKLGQDSLIFIGYELEDWEFRVILQGLLRRIAQTNKKRHVGVQIAPGSAIDEAKAKEYLKDYLGGNYRIDIYWGSPQQFVSELHSRWKHYRETGDNVW